MRDLQFLVLAAMFLAAPVIVAGAPSAISATVTLGLISRQIAPGDAAGEWELWAWTSEGDNDGIMGYAVEIDGEEVAGVHTSPLVVFRNNPDSHYYGFRVMRNPIPDPVDGNLLYAYQSRLAFERLYGVGSPDVPDRISAPNIDPILELTQPWWLNPSFSSSPYHPALGDNSFAVPAGAVQLGVGSTSRFNTLNYGATLVISVFEFGQAYTGTSGGNRVEVADIALLLEHVRAIPEPRSGVLGFIIVAIVLLFTRRELALDYCPNRRTTQAIRIAKLCSTCSGHFDRCEFLNSQTAPGWTSFSGLGTAQNAGGENDRQ